VTLLVVATTPFVAADDRIGRGVEPNAPPTLVELETPTRVVVLGTSSPVPDPDRTGASIAVIHKGEAYIFDLGAGSTQQAIRAREKYDIPSLNPLSICCVFLTHLHSDHIADLPVLAGAAWWRRSERVQVFGPEGLTDVAAGFSRMMAPDVKIRQGGTQPGDDPLLDGIVANEISAGTVYQKDDLTIEAFEVPHGEIEPAFGYLITTDDLSVVISGDTAYSQTLVEKAKGVDLLFHEYVSDSMLSRMPEPWQKYLTTAHTTTSELAEIANLTRPGKLILYHGLYTGVAESKVLDEVRSGYDGEVLLAEDLDIF
jgi:ribonuclease BN (tRNA processing enzyme)